MDHRRTLPAAPPAGSRSLHAMTGLPMKPGSGSGSRPFAGGVAAVLGHRNVGDRCQWCRVG